MSLVTRAVPGWAAAVQELPPGAHVAVLTDTPQAGLEGRLAGLELRDTLLVLRAGPSSGLVFLSRVPLAEPTLARQVLETGTGAIHIDACRVATSPADAHAMERANSPGSWRMQPSGSSIGTFVRSSSSGALDTAKGRWPPNILFVHGQCTQTGTKKVAATSIARSSPTTAVRRSGAHSEAGGHQAVGRVQPVSGYADDDGQETVAAWECEPRCPVRLLDGQSGELRTNPGTVTSDMAAMGYHGGSGSSREVRADSGGASRFFPQFRDDAEMHAWLGRLIGAP